MRYTRAWEPRAVSPTDAVEVIKSGMRVFLHGAAATPTPLIESLCDKPGLEGVKLYHLHTSGPCRFADESQAGRFFSYSLFTGAALRKPIEEGRADFIPIFLSDIPGLFTSQTIPLDVAVVQLSPPDGHGWCTLGTSVDTAKAAVDSAKYVIAEINDQMPRTHGNSFIHVDRVHAFIHTNRPLNASEVTLETPAEGQIGECIARLVEDGSCLQVGIGGIPNAVLKRLKNKNDLGVHTEMFSDNIVDLVDSGVITNRFKRVHPGRLTTSFVVGSKVVFDFVHDNPNVEFHPCDRTNDTALIRKNDKMVAINSAIEIDLTGQVCADSMGHRIFSGIGGQMDFIRGAALSKGGKPIIALPSTASSGKLSRIVLALKPGAGVVTTRGHVHWVVTEYGAVNLHGLGLRERGEALISISHPDFRLELKKALNDIRHFAF
ncbi:acetyl-CoA hydrolase/transferase C-terminal domain-containing protein [Bdellovibrionota bacterium FG-2]